MARHPIPKPSAPEAIYWLQPDREAIKVDDIFATMGRSAFQMLSTYRDSPSVVYAGKMWKREWESHDGTSYYLCWYDRDPSNPLKTIVCQRRIILK